MKKIIVFILLCLMIFSVACQPTPDKPFVESKNDGELEASVYGDPVPELENGYDAPETWTETIESDDGLITVNVNAELKIPDATKYPVYRVGTRSITQEEADAFVEAFIGDQSIYDVDRTRIKSVIEKEIERKMKHIAEFDDPNSDPGQKLASGAYTQEDFDYWLNRNKEELAALQEEYKNAPSNFELKEIGKEFRDTHGSMNVIGVVMRDDTTAQYFNIQTEYEAPFGRKQGKQYISKYKVEDYHYRNKLYGIEPSLIMWHDYGKGLPGYDDAKNFADDVIYNKLKYSDYELNHFCLQELVKSFSDVDIDDPNLTREDLIAGRRFVFVYTRTIDNIPMLFYSIDRFDPNSALLYSEKLFPHFVVVYVRDNDDYEVFEQSTLDIKEQLNPNAKMLPFEEIQDIFRRYILISADTSDQHLESNLERGDLLHITYNITEARLGYIRIPEKNNTEYGLLVPVWNFYGKQVNRYVEGYTARELDENCEAVLNRDPGNAFLCINAIDGSIINLDLGY